MAKDIAWKLEDKDWVKARKDEWKEVKKKLDVMLNLDGEQKNALKRYFLTGDEGRGDSPREENNRDFFTAMLSAATKNPHYPINKIPGYLLFVLWFHPDQSEEHWDRLKANRDGGMGAEIRRFMEINTAMHVYGPEGTSFFDGLERRLCEFFNLTRLRRSDYPHLDDKQFEGEHRRSIELARSFEAYLGDKDPSPFSATRWQVQRWHDALLLGYQEYEGLDALVKRVDQVLNSPDKFHKLAVELANEIIEVFEDSKLPQETKEYIADTRAGKRRKKVFPKRLP